MAGQAQRGRGCRHARSANRRGAGSRTPRWPRRPATIAAVTHGAVVITRGLDGAIALGPDGSAFRVGPPTTRGELPRRQRRRVPGRARPGHDRGSSVRRGAPARFGRGWSQRAGARRRTPRPSRRGPTERRDRDRADVGRVLGLSQSGGRSRGRWVRPIATRGGPIVGAGATADGRARALDRPRGRAVPRCRGSRPRSRGDASGSPGAARETRRRSGRPRHRDRPTSSGCARRGRRPRAGRSGG